MKFDHLRHGRCLPGSSPVSCSCHVRDGGKLFHIAAVKNIGHPAAVVCGTKSGKTDRYPPFGGVLVCVSRGASSSCMELLIIPHGLPVKSTASFVPALTELSNPAQSGRLLRLSGAAKRPMPSSPTSADAASERPRAIFRTRSMRQPSSSPPYGCGSLANDNATRASQRRAG